MIEINNSDKTKEIEIGTFSEYFLQIKNYFYDNIRIFQMDKKDFYEKIKKFDNVIFISKIGYEPLFGFSGTPSILMRNCRNDLMNEFFHSNEIISPKSGQVGEPLKMALEFCNKLGLYSIEVLSNSIGFLVFIVDLIHLYLSSISDFKSKTKFNIKEQKSLIISSG